jgi:hypothetical protein
VIKRVNKLNTKIRKYDQVDYNSIIHEMEGQNWSILFENKTVNENYKFVKDIPRNNLCQAITQSHKIE